MYIFKLGVTIQLVSIVSRCDAYWIHMVASSEGGPRDNLSESPLVIMSRTAINVFSAV